MEKHKGNYRHGLSHTRIDNIYKAMISRCYKSNNNRYKNYGGKGIEVCDEWKNNKVSFFEWALRNGYDDNLTLDRKNPNGNYCPNNCRWATYEEQENNRTNNRILEYKGESYTMTELAKKAGMSTGTLFSRLNRGWTVEKSVETKVRRI